MIDYSLPYCTYISRHPSGFEYRGKGRTKLVLDGKYIGSGTRFKLTCKYPGFEPETWTATIVATFLTSNDAYIAEADLIKIEDLLCPFLINDCAGGRKGAYQTRHTLMKNFTSAARVLNRAKKKQQQNEKIAALKKKIKELK